MLNHKIIRAIYATPKPKEEQKKTVKHKEPKKPTDRIYKIIISVLSVKWYLGQTRIIKRTGLSKSAVTNAVRYMVESGVLVKKQTGLSGPHKRYSYRIGD